MSMKMMRRLLALLLIAILLTSVFPVFAEGEGEEGAGETVESGSELEFAEDFQWSWRLKEGEDITLTGPEVKGGKSQDNGSLRYTWFLTSEENEPYGTGKTLEVKAPELGDEPRVEYWFILLIEDSMGNMLRQEFVIDWLRYYCENSSAEYYVGSGKSLSFEIKRGTSGEDTAYENFEDLYLYYLGVPDEDGGYTKYEQVENPVATVSKGSAIITFPAEYLETLELGDYDVDVAFKDGGYVYLSFTLTDKAPAEEESPKTGETMDHAMYLIMTVISAAGLAYILIQRKRVSG